MLCYSGRNKPLHWRRCKPQPGLRCYKSFKNLKQTNNNGLSLNVSKSTSKEWRGKKPSYLIFRVWGYFSIGKNKIESKEPNNSTCSTLRVSLVLLKERQRNKRVEGWKMVISEGKMWRRILKNGGIHKVFFFLHNISKKNMKSYHPPQHNELCCLKYKPQLFNTFIIMETHK